MKNKHIILGFGIAVVALCLLQSCATIPKNVTAVKNFKKDKYLGKWYEIARLDYRFERNLDNATAQYLLNDNGNIKVINKGYNYKKNEWKSVEGKAKFVGSDQEGRLKVSFFGPFYAGYNVVAVDDNYENALVYGGSTKYIWILSRNKQISDQVKNDFLTKAKRDGYDLTDLIWVKHDKD